MYWGWARTCGPNFLKYVQASDSSGMNWETPVSVDPTRDASVTPSLLLVDGKPAISY